MIAINAIKMNVINQVAKQELHIGREYVSIILINIIAIR